MVFGPPPSCLRVPTRRLSSSQFLFFADNHLVCSILRFLFFFLPVVVGGPLCNPFFFPFRLACPRLWMAVRSSTPGWYPPGPFSRTCPSQGFQGPPCCNPPPYLPLVIGLEHYKAMILVRLLSVPPCKFPPHPPPPGRWAPPVPVLPPFFTKTQPHVPLDPCSSFTTFVSIYFFA